MYEFLDRLISLALPRIRDFRGLPADAFDGQGNYSLGIGEQVVFPEVDVNEIEFVQGMDVTLVISGGSEEASRELLRLFGMPLRRPEKARAAG
jgi:large subunit ribosomal protein L5